MSQLHVGPLDLVKLTLLMEISSGQPNMVVGMIDGPVFVDHPAFHGKNIRLLSDRFDNKGLGDNTAARIHGTFVAGVLCANRGSAAPAICPDCTLLVRPIFCSISSGSEQIPSATPQELAVAIVECTQAGARVINMSLAITFPSGRDQDELEESLNYAARRGVIIVVAAGNQGTLGSSVITRHPWTIPVTACDLNGTPSGQSNYGNSIGRTGLSAPGNAINSIGLGGDTFISSGTSVAAPFVTGAIALLWSLFPDATAEQVKLAVTQPFGVRRATIVPPLLDAWAAYQALQRLTQ